MRTHIRMHFERKSNDFNEETYISCTLDEETPEVPAMPSATSSSNQAPSPDSVQSPATSQAFKGNLVSSPNLDTNLVTLVQ